MSQEPKRLLPVRPNLQQLKNQAKDLLAAYRTGDSNAVQAFLEEHPRPPASSEARLADAQLVLAREYGAPSWPRLATCCRLIDAIWENQPDEVRQIVTRQPKLIFEDALVRPSNWGPPMSYAANLGRQEIIDMLRGMGAKDVQHAFVRACLQGRIDTARKLFAEGARVEPGLVMGPCETLNPDGLAFQIEIGARLEDEHGDRLAPMGLLLETYSRNAVGKRRCMAIMEANGWDLPDTPPMALHAGRLDRLKDHYRRDPGLFTRQFSHREIFPIELGCHEDETLALCGTPLGDTTLLHLAVDYDEYEIAEWILATGGAADAPAAVDAEGYGGHTALFGTIVSQPYRCSNRSHTRFARLLLDHGANPCARASLRKALRFVDDESWHEYRDVSVVEWGERFHDQDWVNPEALEQVRAAAATLR
jgi:hypothetical protein